MRKRSGCSARNSGPEHPDTLDVDEQPRRSLRCSRSHGGSPRTARGDAPAAARETRPGASRDSRVDEQPRRRLPSMPVARPKPSSCYEETLRLSREKLGPEHPDTLTSMHNLATAYRAAGRTAEAIELHEETLRLQREQLGLEHPNTLSSMNCLAVLTAMPAARRKRSSCSRRPFDCTARNSVRSIPALSCR